MNVMLKLYGKISSPDSIESGASGFDFEYTMICNIRKLANARWALDKFMNEIINWSYLSDIGSWVVTTRGCKILSKENQPDVPGYSVYWLDRSKDTGGHLRREYRARFNLDPNANKMARQPMRTSIFFPGIGDIVADDNITIDWDYGMEGFRGDIYLAQSGSRKHAVRQRIGEPFKQRKDLGDDDWRIKSDQIRQEIAPDDMIVTFSGDSNLEGYPYSLGVLFEYKDKLKGAKRIGKRYSRYRMTEVK
jgi:hypothetical protein